MAGRQVNVASMIRTGGRGLGPSAPRGTGGTGIGEYLVTSTVDHLESGPPDCHDWNVRSLFVSLSTVQLTSAPGSGATTTPASNSARTSWATCPGSSRFQRPGADMYESTIRARKSAASFRSTPAATPRCSR